MPPRTRHLVATKVADTVGQSVQASGTHHRNAFLFGKIFAKNCMKMKEIGRDVGWGGAQAVLLKCKRFLKVPREILFIESVIHTKINNNSAGLSVKMTGLEFSVSLLKIRKIGSCSGA